MSLSLITPSTEDVVTLAEFKQHARIESDFTEDDSLIGNIYLPAATDHVKAITKREFIDSTYVMKLRTIPACKVIRLPKPPLLSVVSVQYVDISGVLQTLSPTEYVVDLAACPGVIYQAHGKVWPCTLNFPDSLIVTFTCGYADATLVPKGIKHAINLLCSDMYENREDTIVNLTNSPIYNSTRSIVFKYIIHDQVETSFQ